MVTTTNLNRVAEKFAIIYAAGKLARKYGILPAEFKSIGRHVIECFRQHLLSVSVPDNRESDSQSIIKAYYERHKANIIILPHGHASISEDDYENSPGFIMSSNKGKPLLIVSQRKLSSKLPEGLSATDIMKDLVRLRMAKVEGEKSKRYTTKVPIYDKNANGKRFRGCVIYGHAIGLH